VRCAGGDARSNAVAHAGGERRNRIGELEGERRGACWRGEAKQDRRIVNGEGDLHCSRRGWLTRAPPTHPLEERAAEAEEEEPVVECVEELEGTCWADQFLRTRRVKPTENP
jgi:hypothetical protein